MDAFTVISHENRPFRFSAGKLKKAKRKAKKTSRRKRNSSKKPRARPRSRSRTSSRRSRTSSRTSSRTRSRRSRRSRRTTGVRSTYEILSLIGYKKQPKKNGAKKKK